jgi:hypothetical protein
LQRLIPDESDSIQVVGEETDEVFAGTFMDDEEGIHAACAKDAEVVIREDRFAAETGRGMLSDDEDAERTR